MNISKRCPALTIYTSLPMLKMEFDTGLMSYESKMDCIHLLVAYGTYIASRR